MDWIRYCIGTWFYLMWPCRFTRGKYLMKGVMVLSSRLLGARLREQLIKTAAGRLSITAGAPAGQRRLESGACRPLCVFTKAPGLLMLAQRAKIALPLTEHQYALSCICAPKHTQSTSGAAARHSWKRFPKMLNLPSCCPLKLIRACELLSKSH